MPDPARLEELVQRLAQGSTGRTEADIQHDVATLLDLGDFDLDESEIRLESPTSDGGRIDVEIGRTVIEVKRNLTSPSVRAASVSQLAVYLRSREAQTGVRHAGVLSDGSWWGLYRVADEGEPRLVGEFVNRGDVDRLVVWLEGALATKQDIKPTPEAVRDRLGFESSSYRLDIDSLKEIHSASRTRPEVVVKQMLWERLLADALGLGFSELTGADKDDLFVRHTYLVAVAEIVAHMVIDIDVTTEDPGHLITGALFRRARVSGVVEADFFDWLADTEDGLEFLRLLSKRLSRFDFREPRHDVFKVLYESVIDADTRHSLGEYYTPDWLASQIVDEVVDSPLQQVVLDPACGSGTFLFWTIKRKLSAAEEEGLSVAQAIAAATESVYGIDLHPVAVTLARVTVLLAIGHEKLQHRGDLRVQVFLGDSMMWRQPDDIFSQEGIMVHTTDGHQLFADVISFPAEMVDDLPTFDQFVSDLTRQATNRSPGESRLPLGAILNRVPVEHRPQIEEAYSILCDLHDNRRNHIWGYYIRNLARPFALARRKVDRLIGNPPWLAYRYMDPTLQEEFRIQALARGLWAGRQLAPHQDLSGFFVARSVERFLDVGGRFGFVMPAGALKGRHHEGFRSGDWSARDREVVTADLNVANAWRLTEVKPHPFPIPSSVIFGERTNGESRRLSNIVDNWVGRLPTGGNLEWPTVAPVIARSPRTVRVATGEGSEYRSEFSQGATFTPRRLVTVVERSDTSSIGPGHGRKSVQSRVSSYDKAPWRDLDPLDGVIEDQFLKPLYMGESIVHYRTLAPALAVVPHNGHELMETTHPEMSLYPGLAEWWHEADRLWRDHRSPRSPATLLERVDYHSGLSRQYPIPARRVVYTTSGSTLAAALVEDDEGVIDTKLYWAHCHSLEEGHYLLAILNSQSLLDVVSEYQSEGAYGPRDFHKHVFEVPFPRFDATNQTHRDLSRAGHYARELATGLDLDGLNFVAGREAVRDAIQSDGIGATIEELVQAVT